MGTTNEFKLETFYNECDILIRFWLNVNKMQEIFVIISNLRLLMRESMSERHHRMARDRSQLF